MTEMMTTGTSVGDETVRLAGTIGFYGGIAIAIVLVIHPFGDGFEFLDHVNAY